MKLTTLDLIRRVTPQERKKTDADFVFIRIGVGTDRVYRIYVSKPTEDVSWFQWGENNDILSENVDAVVRFFNRL